ncbi:SMC-Scp complex subunit ScpB [Brevibacterium samyangense]|uniref:SMC-Scp complex subunit ScpB n=1 Tax=Brevibacterium samyangense TaxID=366888 RepID=A0ABN2TCN4_9MICO
MTTDSSAGTGPGTGAGAGGSTGSTELTGAEQGVRAGVVTPEVLSALEAVLMVADRPLEPNDLEPALGIPAAAIADALAHLSADYDGDLDGRVRGFELSRVAGGWRIHSRAEHHDVVKDFVLGGATSKLSQAALETLAVVAYRQPVTRARISAIRGVNVDGVVRTLLLRGLVVESGVDEVSGATRYVTTPEFLTTMGLQSLEDLPDIAPFLPSEEDLPGEE